MSELGEGDLEELVKEALIRRGYAIGAVQFLAQEKTDPRGDVYGHTISAKVSMSLPAKPAQEQWNGGK